MGHLKMNFSNYEISIRGKPVKLTLREFDLLKFLVQNPNRVMSRDQILDGAWRGEAFVSPRTVDVHIRHLRKAMESNNHKPKFLVTVRGVGYKFNESALDS